LKIKNYMKTDFKAASCHTPLKEVARLFYETGESILPIVEDDGSLAGIISIEDFILIFLPDYIDLVKSIDFIHDFGALEKASMNVEEMLFVAEDLMRVDYPVLDENDSVLKAAAVLHKLDFQRLPVISGRRLVGMMSMNDVCRAIYDTEGHN
jgi:CBS domain-containing protein